MEGPKRPKRNGKKGLESKARTQQLTREIRAAVEDDSFPVRRSDLPSLTTPFNPWNSFYSNGNPEHILRVIHAILKADGDTDVEMHDSAFKIRGRKFVCHQMCEFQIEMFQTSQDHESHPNHVLVEVQRRSGDGIVFQRFLCDLFCQLNQHDVVSSQVSMGPCMLSPALQVKSPSAQRNGARHETKNDSPASLSRVPSAERESDSSGKKRRRRRRSAPRREEVSAPKPAASGEPAEETPEVKSARMFIEAIKHGFRENKRCAATYLATHGGEPRVVRRLMQVQPDLAHTLGQVLLKSLDAQVVRAVGCAICAMVQLSPDFKRQAERCGLKQVCERVRKRWSDPRDVKCGSGRLSTVRVVPSRQVTERMRMCVDLL